MVITLHNLKILLFLLLLSHPAISKFYQPANWNFFGLEISIIFFLEIGINYVSIIITINRNITLFVSHSHCVKIARMGSYSGPYFPEFGLNTERCSVSLRIQYKCGKVRTRITPNTDTYHEVSVICFGYFMPMTHGVNKKALPIVSPTRPSYQVFIRFVCCFSRNTLSNLFCSDQTIGKNNTFLK